MRFEPSPIPGVVVVHQERIGDERGYFARVWCREELAAAGLDDRLAQSSVSWNRLCGTVRGIHYQAEPHAENKLVRVSRGKIFDVAVDLRPGSPTFRQWYGLELSAENGRMLYIPKGCGHGFQTLMDDVEVCYHISAAYHPEAARGVRWDDLAFSIAWPLPATVIGERDKSYPDYRRNP